MEVGVLATAWIAALTALATGLGALPFAVVRTVSPAWTSRGDALAAGLMLGATGGLLAQGVDAGIQATVVGLVLGVLLVSLGSRVGSSSEGFTAEALARRTGILLVAVMTLHSCAEGVGVGVALAGDGRIGIATAIAIGVHNIPEGLAIALVLVPTGVGVARATGFAVFSSLPQPLLAVPAFLLVRSVEPLLPWGLGLAAGAMLWMVFARLLVDARRDETRLRVTTIVAAGAGAMVLMQLALTG